MQEFKIEISFTQIVYKKIENVYIHANTREDAIQKLRKAYAVQNPHSATAVCYDGYEYAEDVDSDNAEEILEYSGMEEVVSNDLHGIKTDRFFVYIDNTLAFTGTDIANEIHNGDLPTTNSHEL